MPKAIRISLARDRLLSVPPLDVPFIRRDARREQVGTADALKLG
jgi:hypothetical protein